MDSTSIFQAVGGEAGVQRIIDRFYARLDSNGGELRAMYPESLDDSKRKLGMFLTSWWGGPLVYHEHHGQPRMRAAHAKFRLDEAVRREWMDCMTSALEDCVDEARLRGHLREAFETVSHHVRNHGPPSNVSRTRNPPQLLGHNVLHRLCVTHQAARLRASHEEPNLVAQPRSAARTHPAVPARSCAGRLTVGPATTNPHDRRDARVAHILRRPSGAAGPGPRLMS